MCEKFWRETAKKKEHRERSIGKKKYPGVMKHTALIGRPENSCLASQSALRAAVPRVKLAARSRFFRRRTVLPCGWRFPRGEVCKSDGRGAGDSTLQSGKNEKIKSCLGNKTCLTCRCWCSNATFPFRRHLGSLCVAESNVFCNSRCR